MHVGRGKPRATNVVGGSSVPPVCGLTPDKKEARGDRGTESDPSAALAALSGGPGLQSCSVTEGNSSLANSSVRARKHDHPLGPIAK